jgi:transglutaminase-like putative cysteine protease
VPALLGALAVLGGTLAIPPMISGSSWFWPTAEVVLVIWLVGVGARLARIPIAAVIAMQAAAAAIAVTALFTARGWGGVIPNGAVLQEAGELLDGAWTQIRTSVSPAPSSPELSFLICVSVAATAFVVDLLITACRAPALVALPLLCLYAVPASIDVSLLPWPAFAIPAVLYALVLVADGLSGRGAGAGARAAQAGSGLVLACVATVIALVVADSVTGVGTTGRLPRTGTGASTGIGLSPFTSLEGNLQRGEPVDLLRVSGLPQPEYLRTVGLQQWTPNEGWSVDQLDDGPLPLQPITVGETQVTVTPLDYRDIFLPVYNGVRSLQGVDQGWSFDSALESVHRAEAVTPDPYQVTAILSTPSADELRTDSVTGGSDLLDTGDLRPEVIARATEITAGATTAFDKASALVSYFTDPANGFTYSLDVPTGTTGDKLLDFLDLKQGFCEQYASAMAVMLRAVGVPARVAVGFTQGRLDASGDYVITSNDAHAWVEVPFSEAGWVEFDPTPLGGGQGGQQGFTTASGEPTPAVPPGVAPTTARSCRPASGGRWPSCSSSAARWPVRRWSGAAAGTNGWPPPTPADPARPPRRGGRSRTWPSTTASPWTRPSPRDPARTGWPRRPSSARPGGLSYGRWSRRPSRAGTPATHRPSHRPWVGSRWPSGPRPPSRARPRPDRARPWVTRPARWPSTSATPHPCHCQNGWCRARCDRPGGGADPHPLPCAPPVSRADHLGLRG